ncbi:BREX system P-loop protein BrxC [Marinobacterium sedimentorum]|uniref:BREX system P-loop protein BrxC n=1 Tax=Marinobacterium sedimentorum TaxID=2927804 RepID=UPI0020C66B24|nr:BREX system P-loop protein BrxC [Marinobacterium sedimentorum]MCP8687150.1 BREX system P-loop protein BrxC [Marinobacterium sedimentorum]
MEIKSLFDSNKDIYRTIEKVITYGASQEERLKAEISEYVVTDSIEEQLENLLQKMDAAMEAGGQNEVGVWVSGFYGSGKSSFTKYLGLAFDDKLYIDGVPFIQHLQDRLKKNTTKALLNKVAKRFPASVLMLDLASEQVAGATMEEVSTVLYYKVLQWAGYSRNLKVAALERRLKQEGRHDEFLQLFRDQTEGEEWENYRNDELVVDSVVPELAHQLYPQLFKNPSAFSTATSEVIRFENDRVEEMLQIAREATGKEYIIFIVDEVGQYVGSRQNLILNLDGLAKNLKNIGDGKVWIIGTAQQTLTEDDNKAALNSAELYKLKDRFPIQIDLEANDIKEICYTRLLGKSAAGEADLGQLFDQHGQALRHNTKLVEARAYGAGFNRQTFIDLYPFLPAHFDILLHLLGALAKSTGGYGLRSAIKVVQDILVEDSDGRTPVANQPVGWLANTVTLFDALEKDIRSAFGSLYGSVDKVKLRFPDSTLHQDIAKTVCILQILNNLPVSRQNVASLLHSGIAQSSVSEKVAVAVEELISDAIVPFGEQDGNLCFFSEKLNEIEQERASIATRSVELRRIVSEALKEVYSPLPASQLNGTLSVQTGLKVQTTAGSVATSLMGERNAVQTIIELVDPVEYDNAKTRLTNDSRQKAEQYNIYLLGRTTPEMDELTTEIFRCREVSSRYRNEPDQEVKDYCAGQTDRANRLMNDLERQIRRSLQQGSFLFRGTLSAVDSLSQDLVEAARKHLADVAEQVFDRNAEAPVRAGTDLAEKFLRLGNLAGVTHQLDPLNLVQTSNGTPSINTQHKAIISIRDMIERQGAIEGKRLADIFTSAPFGWSPDTLRYLVAAMLIAGEIKLKAGGREVTVNGQQAIDALKTNNSFKAVGISLREERPSMEVQARAAERLTELTGDIVVPLEDEISKVTVKLLPRLQHEYGPLAEKLKALGLPGSDRLDSLAQDIRDILFNDASDAPQRLGGEESDLFNNLKWAADLRIKLEQGLEETLRQLQIHIRGVNALPASGIPGQLKAELVEEISNTQARLQQADFFKYSSDFASTLTTLKSRVRDGVIALFEEQKQRLKSIEPDLRRLPEWPELTQQEQNNLLADLEQLIVEASEDLAGLQTLVNQEYNINTEIQDLKQRIQRIGRERLQEKVKQEQDKAVQEGKPKRMQRQLSPKTRITSLSELDALISELSRLRGELHYAHEFELTLKLQDED